MSVRGELAEPSVQRDLVRVFPALDAVRAVGALMVLVTHVAFWTGSYDFDVWGTFLSRLDAGVALFFVLSGFLLSRPFVLQARGGRTHPPLGNYLWKRGLRVLPVYWIVGVVALLTVQDNADADLVDWLQMLTLTDLYLADSIPAGITQTWSLATEVAFYALLPLLMVAWNRVTRGRRADLWVLTLLAVAAILSVAWIIAMPPALLEAAPMAQQWLPTFFVWFVAGIALAHVHVHHVEHPADAGGRGGQPLLAWVPELGRQPGVCLMIAGAVLLMVSTPLAGPPVLFAPTDLQLVTKILSYTLVGVLVVLAAACAPVGGAFQRVMAHPVSRHLGHISYGVFCVHVLVLHLVTHVLGWEQFAGGLLRFVVVTLAISLALAEVLYRLVERPSSALRRVGSRRVDASRARGTSRAR